MRMVRRHDGSERLFAVLVFMFRASSGGAEILQLQIGKKWGLA